jgi:hypothetical protein
MSERSPSQIDSLVAERLADWAVRDAEIGRAAQVESLEARVAKLEYDVEYMSYRAATLEDRLVEAAQEPVMPRAWWLRVGDSLQHRVWRRRGVG